MYYTTYIHKNNINYLIFFFFLISYLDLSFNEIRIVENLSIKDIPKIKELYLANNKITKIENLQELVPIKNLELGSNRLREIENLENLVNIETLWLGRNKITEIKGINHLSHLRILSLQSNRLTEIGVKGLVGLNCLEELYLSHNGITDIDGLQSLKQLRTLDISANKIKTLVGLNELPDLDEIWCNDNLVDSMDNIEQQVTKSIKCLYFERNPVATHVQYRRMFINMFPQLKQLDATMVKRN